MSDRGDLDAAPSRADVREKLQALLEDGDRREEIANWAAAWIRARNPRVEDGKVWEALKRLAGADLRASRESYLHSCADFRDWLRDITDS